MSPVELTRRRLMLTVYWMLAGLASIFLIAIASASDRWLFFGSAVLFGLAAEACGGLLGLLFGVPRTIDPEGGERKGAARVSYGANTNLEQISDWLTKILVGLGLTQLGPIRAAAGDLFAS